MISPINPQKDIVTKQPIPKRMWLLFAVADHRKYVYTSDDVRLFGDSSRQNEEGRKHYDDLPCPINSNKVGEVDINNTRNYTAMQLNLNPLESVIYNV